MTGNTEATTRGREFAAALAKKDFSAIRDMLSPDIDFRGMTPRRIWEATDADAVVEGILKQWFEESDDIDELVSIETSSIADRDRVAYRFRGHNSSGPFVVEQQVYYSERDDQIDWMRIMCSGFRPT